MARQRASSQQWKVLAIALVGVLVLVGAVYAFLRYQDSKPGTPVGDLEVSVTAGGQAEQIPAYTVCELDAECPGGEPPRVRLPDQGEVTFTVPAEIERNSWRLLLIYDDPAAQHRARVHLRRVRRGDDTGGHRVRRQTGRRGDHHPGH
ncbi:DUF2771 family protein [Corynebacterium wankanglinii]|nr:DUF2771 family protein [Corynebacterium wankanglinii]